MLRAASLRTLWSRALCAWRGEDRPTTGTGSPVSEFEMTEAILVSLPPASPHSMIFAADCNTPNVDFDADTVGASTADLNFMSGILTNTPRRRFP
jgi:hypothetical protein